MSEITAEDTLRQLRWSRDGNNMVAIGLFAGSSAAFAAYGQLRVHAESAGIEDAKSMGMLSLGAQASMEERNDAHDKHTYRFHLPMAVFSRMQTANPDLFTIGAVSKAEGSSRLQ